MSVEDIFQSILQLKCDEIAGLVQAEIDAGTDVSVILEEGLIDAMGEVGSQFSAGQLFVPEPAACRPRILSRPWPCRRRDGRWPPSSGLRPLCTSRAAARTTDVSERRKNNGAFSRPINRFRSTTPGDAGSAPLRPSRRTPDSCRIGANSRWVQLGHSPEAERSRER